MPRSSQEPHRHHRDVVGLLILAARTIPSPGLDRRTRLSVLLHAAGFIFFQDLAAGIVVSRLFQGRLRLLELQRDGFGLFPASLSLRVLFPAI